MALGAVVLLMHPEHRPRGVWTIATVLFPAWIVVQLLPLPRGLVETLSPSSAAWRAALWPAAAKDCAGHVLADSAPRWLALSIDPLRSREFLFQVLAGILCFLAARALCAEGGAARRTVALWSVAVFTAGEAVYGIAQALAENPRVLWVVKAAYPECASGTLINRNHFAALLYLGMGATATVLFERLEYELERGDHRETALRVTLGLLLVLQFAGVVASRSRAGIAGAVIVLLCAAPALWRAPRNVRFAVLGLALAVLVPIAMFVGGDLVQRVLSSKTEWSGGTSRGSVLRLSGNYLRDFVFVGSGAGTFEFAFSRYRTSSVTGLYDYAHNDYLQILLETGAIGLFTLLRCPWRTCST